MLILKNRFAVALLMFFGLLSIIALGSRWLITHMENILICERVQVATIVEIGRHTEFLDTAGRTHQTAHTQMRVGQYVRVCRERE